MATRSSTPATPTQGRFTRPGQEPTTTRREPRSRVRWMIVGLCFAGLTVNYVDRANLSVALPKMSDELGIGPGVEGVVLAMFFASYAICQLPVGHLVDRLGARIVFAVAGLWWSIFTAATALVGSVASLLGFRFALGAGEAGGYPASAKAVSEWFPVRERAFATSIYDSGARAGTALALPVVTALIALAVVVPTAGEALALLSLCYASLTFAAASVWSRPADVAPTSAHVASLGGIQNFASNLAGVLGATTTGALIAFTGGSYVAALVLSGGLALLGAFSYLVIVGRIEPLPPLSK